jgi:hypothetical protein
MERQHGYREACQQCAENRSRREEAERQLAEIVQSEEFASYKRYASSFAHTDAWGRMKPVASAWLIFLSLGTIACAFGAHSAYAESKWGKLLFYVFAILCNVITFERAIVKVKAERARKGL